MQYTAGLDNIRLFVQGLFYCESELGQTLETHFYGPSGGPHYIINLSVSLIEPDLFVIWRVCHRSQNMFT